MQFISVKGDIIEVNPYAIQPFLRVQCICYKGQIQAGAFLFEDDVLTVFPLHPEAIMHWHASSGLRDHYSECFTWMTALKF